MKAFDVGGREGPTEDVAAAIDSRSIQCGLVEVSQEGRIRWVAGRAPALMEAYWPAWRPRERSLPRPLQAWIGRETAMLEIPLRSPVQATGLIAGRDHRQLHLRLIHDRCRILLWVEERMAEGGKAEDIGLTQRENQVLDWIARGKTNREIGLILGISARTVQKHAERLYEKLGVETRLAAATYAMRLNRAFLRGSRLRKPGGVLAGTTPAVICAVRRPKA